MQNDLSLSRRHPVLMSAALWIISIVLTFGCILYQDRTGPTYPLEGSVQTPNGPVSFKLLRSETIGTNLRVMLVDPVPAGVGGVVRYRRYRSHDPWSVVPMTRGTFAFTRRGRTDTVRGIGAELPSLRERAGKYEYFMLLSMPGGRTFSVTGDRPVYARYKADVPMWALAIHILTIFASMLFAIRATLEAIADGRYRWMIHATIISLVLGGFVFGPIVQWYAFGVFWSGVPFGIDWTDNKVLFEIAFWIFAAFMNRRNHRARWPVYLAGIATLVVYFIPHSVFGSEYDYTTGSGRGTAG